MAKLKKLNKVTSALVTKSKKKKKKLAFGDFLRENQEPIGQGLSLAGDLTGGLAPEGSKGGGIASGALKGAGSLAALGPGGMAAGAVIGGVMGAINAKKIRKEEENIAQAKSNAIQKSLMEYKKGGRLKKRLGLIHGGDLNSISKDAVEVSADNPSLTDSVELDDAFVDHNEVIDNQDRVFSDEVKMPDGKSIAKHAKKLEKMKSTNSRFNGANSLLDKKLDELFNYQEEQNKPKLKKGGKMSYEPGGELADIVGNKYVWPAYERLTNELADPKYGNTGPYENALQATKNRLKNRLDPTSRISPYDATLAPPKEVSPEVPINYSLSEADLLAGADPASQMRPDQVATKKDLNRFKTNAFLSKLKPKNVDASKAITTAATFGPNLVSQALQARLKGPAAPQLESSLKLKRISPTAQLAEVNRQTGAVSEAITKNTAQGADLIAGQGSLLAKKLNAQNQVYGQVNNQNANIANQEAYLNQGVKSRNVQRINQFQDAGVDFSNIKKKLTSENVANLADKVLKQGAEKNMRERDALALSVLEKAYGDSGVLARLYEKDPELAAKVDKALQRKANKRRGGKLYSKGRKL